MFYLIIQLFSVSLVYAKAKQAINIAYLTQEQKRTASAIQSGSFY